MALAGAVGADQPCLFALQKRGGGLNEQNLVTDLLGDIVEPDHALRWRPKKQSIAGRS